MKKRLIKKGWSIVSRSTDGDWPTLRCETWPPRLQVKWIAAARDKWKWAASIMAGRA